MGGKEIPLPRAEKMRHHLPSEVLIMKADGTFVVTNDIEDKADYKMALLESDDLNTVGGEKAARRRQREQEDSNRRGGFGGFGGDDDF